ncbi:MAG: GGDEF domain-containing protein [bacterium]|nr:GGDEF domain-containing protein [bacterium]
MRKRHQLDTEEITVLDEKRKPGETVDEDSHFSIMLTIIQGSDVDFGKTFNISRETVLIGRDKDNDIQVDDSKISKIHFEINIVKANNLDQVVIKDMDSTNGTYVNDKLIRQRVLESGDKITIGQTVLRINYNDEIEEEYRSKLFNFAATDALTGLYNRRYIINALENHYKIAKRNDRVFSIAVFDIDDFKQINDSYGHTAGDEFLKKVTFVINNTLREQDIPGRLGGEEFLVILPETHLEGAYILANRIREEIQESEVNHVGARIKATISAGVSQYDITRPPASAEALFQLADNSLYEAKKSGKNRVNKTEDQGE